MDLFRDDREQIQQVAWGQFLESPDNQRVRKAVVVYMKDRSFNSFASHMIKLSVNETKWSSLLARTRALIPFIWISIFDFGPEKLSGLYRYRPLKGLEPGTARLWVQSADHYSTLSLPVWLSALHYNQRGLAAETPVSRPPLMSHPRKRHLRLLQSAAPASNEPGATFAEIMSFLHTSLLSSIGRPSRLGDW